MNHRMIKLCTVFLAFTLAFIMPLSVLQAAPTFQDATPTPAAEEEAETEEAMEETDTDEADTEEAATEEMEAEETETMAGEEELQLATATVKADLVRPGRVLMSARGNHWVYDSVPPINGPNEEVNPLDGMLSALIGCGMYIYEAVGIEEGITTDNLSATVTGQLDGRGVAGANVNPRVRAFDVTMNVDGPTADEAAMMVEAFSQRCPIYTTLALSAPISVTNVVDGEAQETIATEADPIVDHDILGEELTLGMPTASGRMIEFGRSVMSARGNYWINDSVPPINGPNEEVNPLDMFVGALPACGVMIYEAVSIEEGITLNAVNATVEADLDPRGVAGADVNPRIRAFRVTVNVDGPTAEEADMMAEQFSRRCPIYTTFERSAPIEVTNHMMGEGTAVLDVTFTYDFDSAEEYVAEVSPLAEQFAAIPGLVWKTWTLDPETKRAGAVYLFEDATVRQTYMDGELFGAVKGHPALSDHRIRTYDVMLSESLITYARLQSEEGMAGESAEAGMLLDVEFTYDFDTAEEYVAEVAPLAEQFAAIPGLVWKVWTLNPEEKRAGAAYYFADAESLEAYMESELFGAVKGHPALSGHEISTFQVMAAESTVTYAPIK
ncbi:MAG: YdhR family protein [Caldilineaceae bacterium]